MAVRTSYKQGTPSWVELATTDQSAAKVFYGSLFGWSWDDTDLGNGNFYSVARLKDKSAAAVYTEIEDEVKMGIPPHWTTYITVDDIEATAEKVNPAGGHVLVPPMDIFEMGRMAVISDPIGGVVGLWQAQSFHGAEILNEPGALAWNELVTDDVKKVGSFFETVLNIKVVHQVEPFAYTLFQVDESGVGGLMEKLPGMESIPNAWVTYFSVDDTDSTTAKAESLGGKVMVPPMDTVVGRFARLMDPHGAMFSVIKQSKVMP